jgi:pilus assembly protein Flp/PilA
MTRLTTMIRAFAREEDGIALTEYLILLGLLVAGVIGAVTLAGQNLDAAGDSWGSFFTSVEAPAAAP